MHVEKCSGESTWNATVTCAHLTLVATVLGHWAWVSGLLLRQHNAVPHLPQLSRLSRLGVLVSATGGFER